MRLLVIVSIILVQFSCAQQQTDKTLEAPFFDLKGYFSQEQERLSLLRGFEKKVELNGQIEEGRFDTLDWEIELKAFSDANINLPAWYDKYAIDSVFSNNELYTLHYHAIDSSLRIQAIQIEFEQKAPSKIQIERKSNSPLAQTFKSLVYEPDRGYSILNIQHLRMSEEKKVSVQVRF